MFKLAGNPILFPYQQEFLLRFFASPLTQTFFLTGGTALAAFYFGHRESKDFDLFSIEPFPLPQIRVLVEEIGKALGATVTLKITSETYQELYLSSEKDGWVQRVDIVREQPRHFGTIVDVDGVRVDSLENIGSNKILTLFSRLEAKDYMDFYTIVSKTSFTFDELFNLAKQKDTGLFEFYFANSIANVDQLESWPQMKIPFDHQAMVAYYQDLSRQLLLRIKPKV